MTYQNRLFDIEFFKRLVQYLRLHLDRDGLVIGAIAVTMTRPIESKSAVVRRQRSVHPAPILTRTGVAVNQNDWGAGAFDYKVQTGVVDGNEFRKSLRILMSNARGEITSLESSGNVHPLSTFWEDSPQRRKERRSFAEETIKDARSIRGDASMRKPAACATHYFLLAGLDDDDRDLVTFSKRVMRRAWRVRICVMPPGTSARTIA